MTISPLDVPAPPAHLPYRPRPDRGGLEGPPVHRGGRACQYSFLLASFQHFSSTRNKRSLRFYFSSSRVWSSRHTFYFVIASYPDINATGNWPANMRQQLVKKKFGGFLSGYWWYSFYKLNSAQVTYNHVQNWFINLRNNFFTNLLASDIHKYTRTSNILSYFSHFLRVDICIVLSKSLNVNYSTYIDLNGLFALLLCLSQVADNVRKFRETSGLLTDSLVSLAKLSSKQTDFDMLPREKSTSLASLTVCHKFASVHIWWRFIFQPEMWQCTLCFFFLNIAFDFKLCHELTSGFVFTNHIQDVGQRCYLLLKDKGN